MNVLITGNLGYVGPAVVKEFRQHYPEAEITGYDAGYFSRFISHNLVSPDIYLTRQIYGDVRKMNRKVLEGVDTVVHLAAISNDPIGNKFEEVTYAINYEASKRIATLAKEAGVKNFIFASSCSVYGFAEDEARTENSALNPLTAYAKSKVMTEEALKGMESDNFKITCLRFATACGMSDRLRLDLVINDFVAAAYTTGTIKILSDGSPWRPSAHFTSGGVAKVW